MPAAPQHFILLHLNARLQPLDRAEHFEDPLQAAMEEADPGPIGEITGGGSQLAENFEIEYCDVEIAVHELSPATIEFLVRRCEALGAPKGSYLQIGETKHPVGVNEGLALYLDGTSLPQEVYESSDVDFIMDELQRLSEGRILSTWDGPTETALYLYGPSFSAMQASIAPFLASYPLCQNCRVVQIA
jgi:hypothetical protein